MSNEYKNNHYVPVWYQRRFVPDPKQSELYYLHLNPTTHRDSQGNFHKGRSVWKLGFDHCFAEEDLYTLSFNGVDSNELEKQFFGEVDKRGRKAVDWATKFTYPWDGTDGINDLLMYMSTQKLRTPKGLAWLEQQIHRVGRSDRQAVLRALTHFRGLYGATWMECVWQIADASRSETKFIISDHPVTIYNKRCGPRSPWCRDFNDPDIRYHASHTLFPLSCEKILILTNLSWVRNPYQRETGVRPNPSLFRQAIMKITDIQVSRHLSEEEVRQINFILKSRAYRYVAAAKEEWLHPEKFVSKSEWNTYGNGLLLMPDPRSVHLGGTIMWGGGPGPGGAMDEYGRRPGDPEFEKEHLKEGETLYRFKGEFATLFGPARRGRIFETTGIENERDGEKFHAYHLGLWANYKNRWKKENRKKGKGAV